MSDTEFGNYVFRNNLTVFEALSELEVVELHTAIEANTALIVQTRSELHATTQLLDTTVARVNTVDAVLVEVRSEVDSLTTEVNSISSGVSELEGIVDAVQQLAQSADSKATEAVWVAEIARSVAIGANTSADLANTTARAAQLAAESAQTSADQASQIATEAQTTANNASQEVSTVGALAEQAVHTANLAQASVSELSRTVDSLQSLLAETRLLADQIFARENDLIMGWGRYNNQDALFQLRSNLSTNRIMMTNVQFVASVRLVNGATLPYTQFWIRSPGEIGQPSFPAARVRTGQWVLRLTGGSAGAQQLFVDPFNIRDYRQ